MWTLLRSCGNDRMGHTLHMSVKRMGLCCRLKNRKYSLAIGNLRSMSFTCDVDMLVSEQEGLTSLNFSILRPSSTFMRMLKNKAIACQYDFEFADAKDDCIKYLITCLWITKAEGCASMTPTIAPNPPLRTRSTCP